MAGADDDEVAHARSTDPITSHWAAEIASWNIAANQRRVEEFYRKIGSQGATDPEMEEALDAETSNYRSRRATLTERHILVDSGMKRRGGPKDGICVVWRHRLYHPGAEPVREETARVTSAHRAAGRDKAADVDKWADQMKREGRTLFAQSLTEAAELLRILSR